MDCSTSVVVDSDSIVTVALWTVAGFGSFAAVESDSTSFAVVVVVVAAAMTVFAAAAVVATIVDFATDDHAAAVELVSVAPVVELVSEHYSKLTTLILLLLLP